MHVHASHNDAGRVLSAARSQRISYAKGKSDAVAKLDGTFKPRDKRERQKKNESARGARACMDAMRSAPDTQF